MKKNKQVSISDFKARALKMIMNVNEEKSELIILKRGEPIAKVIPFSNVQKQISGKLKGTVIEEIDVVSPIGAEIWESAKTLGSSPELVGKKHVNRKRKRVPARARERSRARLCFVTKSCKHSNDSGT